MKGPETFRLFLVGLIVSLTPTGESKCQNPPPASPKNSLIEPSRELLSAQEKRFVDEIASAWLETKPNIATEKARQHLIDGVFLARLVLPLEEAYRIQIDKVGEKINLEGHLFDLNKPLHFQLLASILEFKFKNRLQDWQYQEEQKGNREIIQDLFWLSEENPPITIESQTFGFLDGNYLKYLSRTLQALKIAGLPFPQKISESDSVVYEIGRFLFNLAFLDPANPRFKKISQDEYKNQTTESLNKYSPGIKNRDNLRISPQLPSTLEEDYALTFERYVLNGSDFRTWVEFLKDWDPAAHQVLKGKYNFFREGLGLEFTNEGNILSHRGYTATPDG